ncbi:hypothetical protein [Arthrobacter sp. MDT1-65]
MTQHTQQHSSWLAASAADLTANDVWLYYFSIGGTLEAFELDAYLHGAYPLPQGERNMIALAVNELIDDLPRRFVADGGSLQRPKAEFTDIPLQD